MNRWDKAVINRAYKRLSNITSRFYVIDNGIRLIGAPELQKERDRAIRDLYRLGESVREISKVSKWSLLLVSNATRGDEDLIKDMGLHHRFCVNCGSNFKPDRITQVFCSRKCFKASYYKKHIKEAMKYTTKKRYKKNYKQNEKPIDSYKIKRCLQCSAPFLVDIPTRKFCRPICRTRYNTTVTHRYPKNNRWTLLQ